MKINEAVEILQKMKTMVGTDDLDTSIRRSTENEAIDTVLNFVFNSGALYDQWAIENKMHVCTTCKRNADNLSSGTRCPIQEHYAILPKNGHCHLWEGM